MTSNMSLTAVVEKSVVVSTHALTEPSIAVTEKSCVAAANSSAAGITAVPTDVSCDICKEKFYSTTSLVMHFQQHHM